MLDRDFVNEMTKEELEDWWYHFGTSNKERIGFK